MRAIAAASMLSGSGASRSDAAARSRSRRNCGLPPERSAASREDVRRERVVVGDRLGEGQRLGSGPSGAGLDVRSRPVPARRRKPAPVSRRATTTSHGSPPTCSAIAAQQVRRGRVHEVRVLDLDQRRLAQPVAQEAQRRRRAARARRNAGASSLDLGASAACRRPKGDARAAASTAAARRPTSPTAARRRSSTTSSGSSQAPPMSGRRSSRQAAYGVEVVYASHVACRRVRPERALAQLLHSRGLADARLARDLDEPPGAAARPSATASSSRASSRVAPDQREAQRHALARRGCRSRRPTDHAWTGSLLALDRERLEPLVAKRVAERSSDAGRRVDRPGRCLGHHARGEVHGVAHDAVAAPVGRPDVAGRRPSRGSRRCAPGGGARPRRRGACASSIRSSSSPTMRGAPAISMSLPPSTSTSDSRKHTWCSSAARCTRVDELVQRRGRRPRAPRARSARPCPRSA